MIRYATKADVGFLIKNRRHITEDLLIAKITRNEVYVAEKNYRIIGWARYNLFWDNLPFLTMIHVLDDYRRQGYGTRLIDFWIKDMADKGFSIVLTSTQADENAQFFYRKIGFQDTGSLLIPNQGSIEIFLLKKIKNV